MVSVEEDKVLTELARKFVRQYYSVLNSALYKDGFKLSDTLVLKYFQVLSREFNDFVPNNYKPRKSEVA